MRRRVRFVLGLILVVIGIPLFISPIPIGFLVVPLGLAVLISSNDTVANWVKQFRRTHPKFNRDLSHATAQLPDDLRDALQRTEPDPDEDAGPGPVQGRPRQPDDPGPDDPGSGSQA